MKTTELVNEIKERLKKEIELMEIKPKLNIVQVGNLSSSDAYIKNKMNMCKELGITAKLYNFPEDITETELTEAILKIKEANISKFNIVKAIVEFEENIPFFVQLPLPSHINEKNILELVDPKYDVDGFTDLNIGKLVHGKDSIYPCTPKGIISILKYLKKDISGQSVLIINRSNTVGKPLAMMLLKEDCTVSIAHSKSKKSDLKRLISNSDIIITAVGISDFFNDKDFNEGQIVIDVSMNINSNGKLCGDISKDCYDKLKEKGVIFTEVPGGVGPMTVISLMENIIAVYNKENNYNNLYEAFEKRWKEDVVIIEGKTEDEFKKF